jgi:hypothetical protein
MIAQCWFELLRDDRLTLVAMAGNVHVADGPVTAID